MWITDAPYKCMDDIRARAQESEGRGEGLRSLLALNFANIKAAYDAGCGTDLFCGYRVDERLLDREFPYASHLEAVHVVPVINFLLAVLLQHRV